MKSFLNFTAEDETYLHASTPVIAPLLPAILTAVYDKLLSYDITAAAFVPRNTDYTGPVVANVTELSQDHPQIAMRKDFLKGYLVKMVSNKDFSDASPFWAYLDKVGEMHTGKPGFKHREKKPALRVELIHIGLLLGFVMDLIVGAVMNEESLDGETRIKVMKAFNKVK
jgi:Protoglobin